MSKGVCFGPCPVYRLSLYKSDLIIYEGQRFTDKMGIWTRTLSKSEKDNLKTLIKICGDQDYLVYYESQLPDLAPTTIYFHDDEGLSQHKFKETAPDELILLSQAMERVAQDGLWKQELSWGESPEYLLNQMVLQLKPEANLGKLIQSYERYGMFKVKMLSENVVLIEYDQSKASPGQLYMATKSDDRIVNVEFKQALEIRSR